MCVFYCIITPDLLILLNDSQNFLIHLLSRYVGINATEINHSAGRYHPGQSPPLEAGLEVRVKKMWWFLGVADTNDVIQKIEKTLNNTHTTTQKRTNNSFCNTKKHPKIWSQDLKNPYTMEPPLTATSVIRPATSLLWPPCYGHLAKWPYIFL